MMQGPELGFDPNIGYIPGMDAGMTASGGGGSLGTWSQGEGANLPGATVEVTEDAGPNWLLIGGGAVVAYLVYQSMSKKRAR